MYFVTNKPISNFLSRERTQNKTYKVLDLYFEEKILTKKKINVGIIHFSQQITIFCKDNTKNFRFFFGGFSMFRLSLQIDNHGTLFCSNDQNCNLSTIFVRIVIFLNFTS